MFDVRAFIACDIPQPILEKISITQDKLKKLDADVSWTNVRGIHITLKFLGNIDEKSIDMIDAVIKEASKVQAPFEAAIRGSGAFPGLKNPRVIWLGIMDRSNGLTGLWQRIDIGLEKVGFEPDKREFKPHLTLGRVKGARGRERLASALSELENFDSASFMIDRVILYKSELKPTGAVYTTLRETLLQENQ